MKEYNYWIVDAFSSKPYSGNPAAIVFDADGLKTERMQTIARHFNLSETVFLCKPESETAHYRARIFTPGREVPFAGHPTVASAFAYYSKLSLEAQKGVRRLNQECGIGIVPVDVELVNGAPFFTLTAGDTSAKNGNVSPQLAAQMLGCDENDLADQPIEVCSGGLPWLIVKLRSIEAVKNLEPDQLLIGDVCRERDATGVTIYCDDAHLEGFDHHVRSFAPSFGITEDPACGSGNIALAIHKIRQSAPDVEALSFACEQGLEIHRESSLHLDVARVGSADLTIRLGGHAVRVMTGKLVN